MNKKQILATVLAGLMTINTLGSCSSNVSISSSSSVDTSVEDTINKGSLNERIASVKEQMSKNLIALNELKIEVAKVKEYMDSIKKDTMGDYRISTIMALEETLEDGTIVRRVPENYILIGSLGYKVEKIIVETKTYAAAISYLEDGTAMYYAPNGGVLSGNMVICKTESYELVTGDEALEVINNYLDNNSLRLGK